MAAVSGAECRTASFLSGMNGATGISDMAGKAARVAVELSGSERDSMERLGRATWPVKPRG